MKAQTFAAAVLLATPAFAQDTETVEVEVERAGPSETQVLTVDMTGTREEAAARAEERFAARDKDGNGVLEGDELHSMGLRHKMVFAGQMPDMDPAEMFDKIDTDGNGSISREEFAAHHKDHPMPLMPRMQLRKIGARDGSDEHRVIVSRYASETPETHAMHENEKTERVIVRKIGEGGTWTDDAEGTVMLDRIEATIGGREDTNGDGKITREEALTAALARFDAMDEDGDGTISDGERPHVVKRVMRVEEQK